jgi:hypothetical protein
MDANAFGLNDTFVVAGLYSSSLWLATVMYQYTPERKRLPGWNIMGMYGRQNRQDTDQHGTELRNYDQETIVGSLGIRYPATEYLNLAMSFSLRRQNISDGDHPREVPDRGAFAGGINPSLEISRSSWDGFLLLQQRASLNYTLTLLQDSVPLSEVSARANYELSIIPGFKAGLRGGIHYAPNSLPIFESSASAVDIVILPRSFSAQHLAGASVGFEKYLYKFSQGTLALLASYQALYSWGPILGDQFDHGVSGAVNFYLSRIALPALGFGVSYNVAKNEYAGQVSIGMSF